MPELPEVETIARGLDRLLAGRRFLDCRRLSPHLLAGAGRDGLRRCLAGRRILSVGRRGKHLLIDLEGGLRLAFHLKMTGQFLECAADAALDGHTHLVLRLGARRELRFRDVRKFGRMRILRPGKGDGDFLSVLGPEPLDIDWPQFVGLVRRRKGRLKSLLLNQEFLAGIGNIYADEILFEAGLHPLRPASRLSPARTKRLWSSMRRVLARAVRRGGSSIRDYADAEGQLGRFQLEHKVYGRAGLPCRRCGAAVRRLVVGGRSTHYCPRCQK